jgi:hypothetical protein
MQLLRVIEYGNGLKEKLFVCPPIQLHVLDKDDLTGKHVQLKASGHSKAL